MHRRVVLFVSITSLVLCAAAWRARPVDVATARASHRRAEVVRLRAHFDSVDVELRSRDVSRLAPAQRAARARLIAWLRDYRERGEFPVNDGVADHMVPIFRDSRGTLCAMAYLIDRSGRGDIVDRVARTRDEAYIRELVDDRALVAWLDSAGLDVAEAARIQPTYGPPPGATVQNDDDRVSGGYAVTSVVLGAASLATAAVNVVAPTRARGWVGAAVGGATVVAGATRLGDGGDVRSVAAVTTAIGAVSVAAAVHALLKSPATRPGAVARGWTSAHEATIAPALIDGPRASRAGLVLHARF